MYFGRVFRPAIVLLLTAALAGCAGGQYSDPVAEAASAEITQAGIYAYDDGDIVRLSGSPEWERQTWEDREDLSSDIVLIVYDPSLLASAVSQDAVSLREVAWVEQEIVAQTGVAGAAGESPWVATDLAEFEHPVDISPLGSNPQMLRVTPRSALDPGLYSIALDGPEEGMFARFGVGWTSLDMNSYAESHCVDRYRASDRTVYARCGTQMGAEGLAIRDLHTETLSSASPDVLVLKGKVENTTDHPAQVPPLLATVSDAGGTPLQEWTFSTEPNFLMPGETTFFQTQLVDPPRAVDNVEVRLSSTEVE